MNYQKKDFSNKNSENLEAYTIFRGNGFSLKAPQDWIDKTVYTIVGPVVKGIQHNIIVTIDHDVEYLTVEDFAQAHIYSLEQELKGCLILKQKPTKLTDGLAAFEVVFRWYPTDELRIYQQQIFVLYNNTGFKLTASFSKKTRKTLGPKVERMMKSFTPEPLNGHQ